MFFCFVHEITYKVDLKTKNPIKQAHPPKQHPGRHAFLLQSFPVRWEHLCKCTFKASPFATISSPSHISFPSPNPISKTDNKIKVGTIPLRLLPVWLLRARACVRGLRNQAPAARARPALGLPAGGSPSQTRGLPLGGAITAHHLQIEHLAPQDSKDLLAQYERENKSSPCSLSTCTHCSRKAEPLAVPDSLPR